MLREKNIVRPSMMPWTTPVNSTYYEGDFGANLTLALEAMNWKDFENRRRSSSPPGTARGIGCSVYVENSGGALSEFADVRFERGGTVVAYVGTGSSGMGIETSFAQVLADELGLKRESIRIVQGDTDKVARGFGSHGSRSMRIGGNAVRQAAKELVEEGQQLAAEMLQHSVGEIVFARGEFFAETSPDQRIDWAAVALHAQTNVDALRACVDYAVTKPSYPNGCHACEVEVDLETGVVRLLRFVMVKDVGYAINPLIVHGQMHGGIAQGVGQALFERVVYEEESGQLLSGSFLDYALPRADDLPPLETHINEQFSAENPLGVKGAGEGGTTGAPPAVVNAVLDALAPIGVTDLEMPLIPERVWRAIEFAKRT
jgi:carbon-monoxide dehydrogenase large subunit